MMTQSRKKTARNIQDQLNEVAVSAPHRAPRLAPLVQLLFVLLGEFVQQLEDGPGTPLIHQQVSMNHSPRELTMVHHHQPAYQPAC